MKSFQEAVKFLLENRKDSLYVLAASSGISRQTFYNWADGKVVPAPQMLDRLLEALCVDEDTAMRVHNLRADAWQEHPHPRSRKAAKQEIAVAKTLQRKLGKRMEVIASRSPFYDFELRPSGPWKTRNNAVPVLVRLKLTSHTAAFTHACEAKRLTDAKEAVIVGPEPKSHRFDRLFDHHEIHLLTMEELLEREWFPPTEDQTEFPFEDS